MQLADFHIVEITQKKNHNKKTRNVVYDDVDIFIEEIYGNNTDDYEFKEIPMKEWSIDDCVNITAELLEDVNKHSLSEEPRTIVTIMQSLNIPDHLICTFAHEYMEHTFEKYGY